MRIRQALRIAALGAALAGCAGAPFEYRSQLEIPEGPGLFSGEEGALVFRPRQAARSAEEIDQ
jgi:hypothetical protein